MTGPDSPRLDRPDIAALGLNAFSEAIAAAGGKLDSSHLRLVVDEPDEEET